MQSLVGCTGYPAIRFVSALGLLAQSHAPTIWAGTLVARHLAQNDNTAPKFFRFESRDEHDLDIIAKHHIKDDLGPLAVDKSLQTEFDRSDRYWKTLYLDYDRFKSHYDGCVNYQIKQPRGGVVPPPPPQPPQPPQPPPSLINPDDVKERDGWKCLCCGSTKRLEIDHIIPRYFGGKDDFDNLQTLCKTCNGIKSDRTIDFRLQASPHSIMPKETPKLDFPVYPEAYDNANWELPLRRWINFYYGCNAVCQIESRNNAGREWLVKLFDGNNPDWLSSQLETLSKQMTKAYSGIGRIEFRVNEDSGKISLGEVLAQIERVEGFQLRIRNGGRKVRDDYSHDLNTYSYQRGQQGDVTVAAWKRNRFFKVCPLFESSDYELEVLNGDGSVAGGNKTLKAVRESY